MSDYITRVNHLLLGGEFDEALKLMDKIDKDTPDVIPNDFEHKALKIRIMIRKGDYEQSIVLIKSIIDQFSQDSLTYIDLSLLEIEATWRLGKLESASELTQIVELLLQQVQTSEREILKRKASIYYNLGVIHRNFGNLDQSLSFAKQGLILQQSQNLIHESAITLNLLGIIYFQKGEYDNSLECYKNSLKINDEVGDIQYVAKILNNLGEIYRLKGDLVKSLNHYTGAHTQFLKLGNKQDILHTFHNIGLILQARGDYEGAKHKLLESLEINKFVRNDIDKSDTLFHLISVLLDLNSTKLAEGYLETLTKLKDTYPQNKLISLRFLIAKSLILTNSPYEADVEKGKEILKLIVDDEIVYHELTVTAAIHLCQTLADELIRTKDMNVLSDLNTYTDLLQSLIDEQQSNILTIEILILQSRFAIIKGKLQSALRYLEHAQSIAQKYSLTTLVLRVEEEIFNFHDEYEKWVSLMQNNIPMHERLEYARITDYVKEAKRLANLLN